MPDTPTPLACLRPIDGTAASSRWSASRSSPRKRGASGSRCPGATTRARHAGFLRAGLIGTVPDTACGIAAATMAGRVLAAHDSVNCRRPAVGERFVARARVVRPGPLPDLPAACERFAVSNGEEKLVATGERLRTVVDDAKTA